MLLFNLLSSVVDGSSGGSGATPDYTMWILLGIFVVLIIVMMYTSNRANKKRQKEAEEKLNNMRVGDRVKTIGGICGIVVEINDDENTFVLETGVGNKGSFIKFDKIAVYQTSHPEDSAPVVAEEEKANEEAPANDNEATEAVEQENVEAVETTEEAAE